MKSRYKIRYLAIWLIGTGFWFILIFPSYGDYTAMSQFTEAISLIVGQKGAVKDFYEKEGICPTNAALAIPAEQISGKYVKSVHLIKNTLDACYVVATMREDAARWVRNKHILYRLTSYQPYQVTCQTDITGFFVPCPIDQ